MSSLYTLLTISEFLQLHSTCAHLDRLAALARDQSQATVGILLDNRNQSHPPNLSTFRLTMYVSLNWGLGAAPLSTRVP